ncbi:MAG TPA: family 20 glycosylhydrolase [Steroidobacteraceae bacterium]|nr:family 20 glycosylhydrolase [Steroidobacteraceae bacterium]
MKKYMTLAMCCLLAACSTKEAPPAGTTQSLAVIPAPAKVVMNRGAFEFSGTTPVRYAAGLPGEQVANYFVDLMKRTRGVALTASAGETGSKQAISFELQAREGSQVGEEAYSLVVSPERIVVSSHSPRGLFYGAVTLWQLSAGAQIPAVEIEDAPRFRWRGLMLDSARHYQSPQFIERLIDTMALHKLNVLHWHLTDDQAWRIEIKKYPKLTEVGAWRVPAGQAAAADIDPATQRPRLYGGFYTQDQVREIVAYAAARHITIVPEIEMPGHASAPIAAYPELGVTGKAAAVPADWGIYPNLYNVEESTFAFLENVLDEVMALFPGEYIHVGGDEAVKNQWQASARVQSRRRELGVKDEHALQSYFIQRIEKYLNAHDRRLIGWDEILEGGLAPNATVMSWRGIQGAVAAAEAGHDTVLSPAPTLYFDNRPLNTAHTGRGPVVSIEDVYRFDPAPAALSEAQRAHILGVQGNLWTEHVRTEERAEYMIFPRAAAIAEVGWSPAARIDWQSFSARLPEQLARYRALGVGFAQAPEAVAEQPGRRTSFELESCSQKISLALEDDAPVQGERAVFLVDILNPCWLYRDADLSQVTAIAASVGQVPFNFQIGDDIKLFPLRKPQTPAGELEVRMDGCEGEKIATLPLAPAVKNYAVTQLPAAAIARRSGPHDLCFTFTQAVVDPMWVVDAVQLVGLAGAEGGAHPATVANNR